MRTGEQGSRIEVISRHISALDGLRAFAILAVIFHHCGEYYLLQNSSPASLMWGFVERLGTGVDLFFALSGFLITGILLDSLQRPYFFKRFYWRRGLRIWPLYYTFLFAGYLFHRRAFHGIGFAPFALYYRNFLGPDHYSDIYLGQFWSLCVEEQFYLVWPLVIYFTPKRLRMPLIFFLMAAAFLFRVLLLSRGVYLYVVYRLPFCHMDVLLAGAAVAVLTRHGMSMSALRKVCWIALAVGFFGLTLMARATSTRFSFLIFSSTLTCISLLFGSIVGLCARGCGKFASAILGGSLLRAISKRSYAMYVFHLVPLYAFYKLLANMRLLPLRVPLALLVILMIGLITYGMAWLSWRYLESPFLRLKSWEWFSKISTTNTDDTHPTE